ncbi:MAG: RdgB/HAM1 family non-canonical purine NTP pyrophosphatase [Bacteroidota bacterium]
MDILFATNNVHKVREIQSLLPPDLHLITLKEAGLQTEIPEPFETLEENAHAKIQFALERTGMKAGFSEDSGLFVQALQGRPGVHSAHYAGVHRSDTDNMQKVLLEMSGQVDRQAFFQTTICLVWLERVHFFTGTCEGRILLTPKGDQGFGYDPIFQPAAADKSFADMPLAEKNQYSHRQKAFQQMIRFLQDEKKSR